MSLSYVVTVQLSLTLLGIGVSNATQTAVAQAVAATAGAATGAVTVATSSGGAPAPAVRRRLLQHAAAVTATVACAGNTTSAAAFSRLADATALSAAVGASAGVPAIVTQPARRELALVVTLQLPAGSASTASAAAAVASAAINAAAAAGTLLASDAVLRGSTNASLAAPVAVSFAHSILAPPLPSPAKAMPILNDRKLAAVVILSAFGLVLALGLTFRACASPKRVQALKARKTFQASPAPAEAAKGDAEAAAGLVAAPAGEPSEHALMPAQAPPRSRAAALLAERAGDVAALAPVQPAPAAAEESERVASRANALLSHLIEAAGASVDEAAPAIDEDAIFSHAPQARASGPRCCP